LEYVEDGDDELQQHYVPHSRTLRESVAASEG